MEVLIGIVLLFSGYTLGWWMRGMRSMTLDDIAKMMEAADRDEPIEQRARRVSSRRR